MNNRENKLKDHNFSDSVEIRVSTKFLGKSDEQQHKGLNVFAYTIDIANHGQHQIKLLSRYWLITDGDGKSVEVQGDGVVGKQPLIAPGETFRYTSASMIKTSVGTMQGFYEFEQLPRLSKFKSKIPIFTLALPNTLH